MVDLVRYINAEHSSIAVEPENWSMRYPSDTWHTAIIDEWIAEGNTIQDYDPYYAMTVEQAYQSKEIEINAYALLLIYNAYSEPVQGITANSEKYKTKVQRRRTDRADKLAGEIVLTQEEKDEAKTDQKLSEYEVKITDDQEKAEINLHKLNTVAEIMSFDVEAESWNVWTPPV